MPVRKRFGQHFLHDPQVIRRIIDTVAPVAGERIVEVGPGRGALTWGLLERAKRLEASCGRSEEPPRGAASVQPALFVPRPNAVLRCDSARGRPVGGDPRPACDPLPRKLERASRTKVGSRCSSHPKQ